MTTDQRHTDQRHRARKRFGQNFLVDGRVIDRIVAAVSPRPGDHLVEIGPGQAAITGPLLESGATLDAIELDYDLAALLEQQFGERENFRLHQGDALAFDFATLAPSGPLRVLGNLPYNISTPLIFHLLEYIPLIRDMHFMLQKEVVERMAAVPSSKTYGRLSVVTQYYCRVDYLFPVAPDAFRPAPKVESAIVRLTPRKIECEADDEEFFIKVVKTVFQQRRKTLRNTLKPLAVNTATAGLPIDLSRRPETLSVEEFVALANALYRGGGYDSRN